MRIRAKTGMMQPMAAPILRCRPVLVKGMPICRLILALAWEIPRNLFQEKPPLFMIVPLTCGWVVVYGNLSSQQHWATMSYPQFSPIAFPSQRAPEAIRLTSWSGFNPFCKNDQCTREYKLAAVPQW